jgi:hypothetical protein
MPLHQVREPVEEPASLGGGHAAPWSFRVEGSARRFHSQIDVGGVGFRDVANCLARGWIDGLESFSGYALNPMAINQ